MPHPRRGSAPVVPRFSRIVGDAPAIQSPHARENGNALPAPGGRQFNPRVAAYTMAFMGVLVGGIVVGAKYREFMEHREVRIYGC
jgi:hypothetical protein